MRLRVLTYNVHRCVGPDRHRSVERVAEVVRHHAPDVVCLQEVVWHAASPGDRADPRRLADLCGLPHGAVGLFRSVQGGAWGNVTLSRFPLEESEMLDVSLRVRLRRTRGVLYTRVHAHRRSVHLFNLHLGLAGFERSRQMDVVLGRAGEVAGDGSPVILAGDMNDWRNRLVRGDATAAGFTSPTCNHGDPGHATYPSREPVAALDKVFLRGPLRAVRSSVSRLAAARDASDHLPVLVDVELTR